MEFADGGGGKEVIKQNGKLKTVKDVYMFYSIPGNIQTVRSNLTSNSWQYFNCMMAEFRNGVGDHHNLGWENMTEDYYNSLELTTDKELEIFLRNNPVEFDNGFIKHSYHRACAMIGRLIKGKSYIPFYMEEEKIYNKPWQNDNKIRTVHPLSNFKNLGEFDRLDKNEYCLTQSSILALMGIRQNDDFDLIISSKLRSELGIDSGYHMLSNNVEIFSENYPKFMVNGATNDNDVLLNYTFSFEGYKFLEPRFYFSRKHRDGDRNEKDWAGIKEFYEKGSYNGYPFSECEFDNWGFEYI